MRTWGVAQTEEGGARVRAWERVRRRCASDDGALRWGRTYRMYSLLQGSAMANHHYLKLPPQGPHLGRYGEGALRGVHRQEGPAAGVVQLHGEGRHGVGHPRLQRLALQRALGERGGEGSGA